MSTYDISGNDVEVLPYQFREISGAFVPLTQRSYATTAPRAIAASAVNPVHVAAIRAAAPAYRAPFPQAPPVNPIRIAAIALPPVMHTDSSNMQGLGGVPSGPRIARLVQSVQRAQPTMARTASQALRDYQQSVSKGSIFGAKGSMASVIADSTPQPQQPAAPTTSADVPLGANDAFQGQGDLPAPPPPVQVGPMADDSQHPVYGYDGGAPPPNPYGYGGGWDSGYPAYGGTSPQQGGYPAGGGGGNPYADQSEPPWGYPPDPSYGAQSYGPSPDDGQYGDGSYPQDYGDDYGYAQDSYGDYGSTDDYGADWGSDFTDDTLSDAYSSSDDLAYQDLDSQYGGGLGNG